MRNRASHGFPRRKLRLCAFFFFFFLFSLLSSSLFSSVLLSICSLFTDPNPDDPLVPEIAQLLKKGASARGGCAIDGASDCSVTTRRTEPALAAAEPFVTALSRRDRLVHALPLPLHSSFLLVPFCFNFSSPPRRPQDARQARRRVDAKVRVALRERGAEQRPSLSHSAARPPPVRRPRVDPHPINSISARCPPTPRTAVRCRTALQPC